MSEPAIREILKRGLKKWEVNFGYDAEGVRRRPYFDSYSDAEAAIADYRKALKAGGDYWAKLTSPERQMIVATLTEIKREGVTVREIFEDWKRWRKSNQQSITTPMPFEKVIAEWKRRKEIGGKTERYIRDAVSMMTKFGVGREQQDIHEIPKWLSVSDP